jgi:predicted dithiol-disulfide oxidoreductase (DUF899 family)
MSSIPSANTRCLQQLLTVSSALMMASPHLLIEAVTRAPYEKIAAFRQRMGWTFPWYSSYGSDFNYDFHATVDDRVAPVQIFYRNQAEMAAAGMPWTDSLRGDFPV